jgi:magnesium transporter
MSACRRQSIVSAIGRACLLVWYTAGSRRRAQAVFAHADDDQPPDIMSDARDRLELSELESMTVVDAAGETVGELVDVIASPGPSFALVTAFIVATDDEQWRVEWEQVRGIDVDAERLDLNCLDEAVLPASISGDEIALVDAVLDNQVLDVERRKFVRVQDVLLEPHDDRLVVAGVDASTGAVMRRMGLGFLSRRWSHKPGDFVAWEQVNLISVRLSRANFVEAFAEIAELHPADLADVVSQVGPRERAAVLAALNAPLAADTLQEMDDELRRAVLQEMPRARAAAVLRHVDPDEAADILAELPQEVAEETLELLPVETALTLRHLASHPEHSAGALMTTDFITLPQDLDAAAALVRIRETQADEAALSSLFVVDADERLVGVVTLAKLVLADPGRTLAALMDDDLVTVAADTEEDEVGRLMTKYNLLVLPVVGGEGGMLGVVTIDDALDAIVPDEWKQRLPRLIG